MARAYFDQNPFGAAPIEQGLDVIRRTFSQKAPSPMDSLSKAIEQPFVTDVIVPGISRIRDEMRIAEQEEQIAAQAEAKRAAAAQFLQQAAAAEQQGLDAEVAAAVSGVDVPRAPGVAPLPVAGPNRVRLGDAEQAANELYEFALEARAAGRDPVQMVTQGGAWPRHMALLREAGLADVAVEILYENRDPAGMATRQLQQTQQRRGEQEAAAAATQRFERALAGELPQVAAEQVAAEQGAQPIVRDGEVVLPPNWEDLPISHPQRAAYRQFKRTGELPAAPAQAAQPQAIQQPQLIEQANRLRQQATALEAEAKGIEATPVYREFGDYAMAFLEALETGDVAKQNALMASVGGSTDYQPAGKGAVGEAMSKDASMRARRDLLDLKKDWLKAQRREKTGLKFINARKKKTTAKTGRAIARSGMGAAEFDKLFMTSEFDKKIGTRQDRTIEYDGQTIDITYSSDPSGALQQLQSLSRYVRGKNAKRELKSRLGGIGTRISGTGEGTAATTKKAEEAADKAADKAEETAAKEDEKAYAAIDKELFKLRGSLTKIANDLRAARQARDAEVRKNDESEAAEDAVAEVRYLITEQKRVLERVRALEDEHNEIGLYAQERAEEKETLAKGRVTAGGNVVTETKTQ